MGHHVLQSPIVLSYLGYAHILNMRESGCPNILRNRNTIQDQLNTIQYFLLLYDDDIMTEAPV